jgi:hypothetical protein
MSEHELTIARNRVERLRAEFEGAQISDEFAERERQKAEREQAELQRLQQMEADRRRALEDSERHRKREEWRDRWLTHGIRQRGWEIPREAELDIEREVRATLENLDPERAEHNTRRLVQAAASKALAPWRGAKESADAVEEALASVSFGGFRHSDDFKARARLAAVAAIEKLPLGANRAVKKAACRGAILEVQREFEDSQTVQAVLDAGVASLQGACASEREEAADLIQTALGVMPAGTSRRELEAASAAALAPIRSVIEARQVQARAEQARREDQTLREGVIAAARILLMLSLPQEMQPALKEIEENLAKLPPGTPKPRLEQVRDTVIERHRNKHAGAQAKSQLIEHAIGEIYTYLLKLRERYEFGPNEQPMTLESKLKQTIRQTLEEELSGREEPEDVSKRMRRLVRKALNIR